MFVSDFKKHLLLDKNMSDFWSSTPSQTTFHFRGTVYQTKLLLNPVVCYVMSECCLKNTLNKFCFVSFVCLLVCFVVVLFLCVCFCVFLVGWLYHCCFVLFLCVFFYLLLFSFFVQLVEATGEKKRKKDRTQVRRNE